MSTSSKTIGEAWALTSGKWSSILLMLAGGMVGWLLNPSIWLVAGPVRWCALLLTRAAQESGYSAGAAGDGGASVGILQFNVANIDTYGDGTSTWRSSPFRSGLAAAEYVSDALSASWSWWSAIRKPWSGVAAFGHLWTHGLSGYASLDTAAAEADAETWTWPSAKLWTLVLVVPATVLLLGIVAFGAYRYRRRRT